MLCPNQDHLDVIVERMRTLKGLLKVKARKREGQEGGMRRGGARGRGEREGQEGGMRGGGQARRG